MTDFPDLKMKAVVQFPARVLDGTGIDIVKSNGSYQFNLDFGDFAPPVTSLTDPLNQNALLWNSVTGHYDLIPASVLTGAGIFPATALPLVDNGAGAVGVSTKYVREDHVHPTDTTRAPTATPTFSGTVTSGGTISSTVDTASLFTCDNASAPLFTIAAGGNRAAFPVTGFGYHKIEIVEFGAIGGVAVYICGGGAVTLLGGSGCFVAPTTTPAVNKASVQHDGARYRIYSNITAAPSFRALTTNYA